MYDERSVLYKKAFKFSKRAVSLYRYLVEEEKEYIISKQVLRSGTSIGANIKESKYAQSRKDFISKINIALKEAGETEYWIELLIETDYLINKQGQSLLDDLSEILKMLISTLKTTKNNM